MSETTDQTEIRRTIQGTELTDLGDNKTWGIITRVGIAIVIVALLVAPFFVGNYFLFVLSLWAVTAIACQGQNLMLGYAGMISLAQGAFMGIGAYTSTLLVQNWDMNYWLAMIIAVIVCFLVGALIGFPALRIDGHYLAFVTIGFNELFVLFVRNEDWTGGPLGLLGIERPSIFGFSLFEPIRFYYFCLVMLGISTLFVWYVIRSSWGRAFKALKDNPNRAESLGLDTTAYTLLAFAAGCGLAGFAGTILAPLVEFIEPYQFQLLKSLEYVLMVMLGGRGFLAGPLIGAFFGEVLAEWLRFMDDYYLIAFALFVILSVRFFPDGIAGFGKQIRRRFFSDRKVIQEETAA